MHGLLDDLRFAFRTLAQAKGFTAVALITLALGVGANTAIFSIVNGILLRPLPFPEPERLVFIYESWPKLDLVDVATTEPNFADWRDQARSFESMGVIEDANVNLTGRNEPERLNGGRIDTGLLRVLRVQPALGRLFTPEDEQRGGVVLLSHKLWARRFGSDGAVLGTAIQLDGRSYEVIGVMPAGFEFPQNRELWLPLRIRRDENVRGQHNVTAIARLGRGVSLGQAQVEMSGIASRLSEKYPNSNKDWITHVTPMHESFVGGVRLVLTALSLAVGFVLLIACANVANLLLARASGRRREIAVRAALGASRGRIVRQLLTESLLLAIGGALAGLPPAYLAIRALRSEAVPTLASRAHLIEFDAGVLIFTAVLALATTVLFGLAPALHASRTDLNTELRQSAGRGVVVGRRLKNVLIAAEVALALVLLAGAGLTMQAFLRLTAVQTGFRPENLISARMTLPEHKYPEPRRQADFYARLQENLAGLPGVTSAGVSSVIPFGGTDSGTGVYPDGRPPATAAEFVVAFLRSVTPGYLKTVGIPLRRGRVFSESDSETSEPVAILSETLARRLWPGEDALGRKLRVGAPRRNTPAVTIVGIAADVLERGLDSQYQPVMYRPYRQQPSAGVFALARTGGKPESLTGALRAAVGRIDADLPVYQISTMSKRVAESTSDQRLGMTLFGIFAALAVGLAVVGIYGVVNYAVGRRTAEIGLRMALGAQPRDVLRLVMRESVVSLGLGVAVGLAATLALSRFIRDMLYRTSPVDVPTLIGVSVLLIGVALLGSYLPARRAMRLDPTVALRYE